MDLSIEQLADLKIAIQTKSKELKGIEKTLEDKVALNNHLTNDNVRLESEIKEQVKIKEALIEENTKLRAEKDVISAEYEEKNAKVYAEIHDRETKVKAREEQNELLIAEITKRESSISDKMDKIKVENEHIKKSKQDLVEHELLLASVTKQHEDQKADLLKRMEALSVEQLETSNKHKELEKVRVEIERQEKNLKEESLKIENQKIELNAREKILQIDIDKLKTVVPLFLEAKAFVANNLYIPEELANFEQTFSKQFKEIFWIKELAPKVETTDEVVITPTEENKGTLEENKETEKTADESEKNPVKENKETLKEVKPWKNNKK